MNMFRVGRRSTINPVMMMNDNPAALLTQLLTHIFPLSPCRPLLPFPLPPGPLCPPVAAQGAAYLTSPSVTAAHASELAAAGGIITAQDLAGAAPQERELLKVQVSRHGVSLRPLQLIHVGGYASGVLKS